MVPITNFQSLLLYILGLPCIYAPWIVWDLGNGLILQFSSQSLFYLPTKMGVKEISFTLHLKQCHTSCFIDLTSLYNLGATVYLSESPGSSSFSRFFFQFLVVISARDKIMLGLLHHGWHWSSRGTKKAFLTAPPHVSFSLHLWHSLLPWGTSPKKFMTSLS